MRGKRWIWITIIALGVLGVGIGGYFLLRKPAEEATAPENTGQEAEIADDGDEDIDDGEDKGEENWVKEEGKRIDEPYFFDVCVVELSNGTYRMYGELNGQIESYISADGLEWEKENGLRMANAAFPFVHKTEDDKWRMFYSPTGGGSAQTYFLSAISDDGLTFEEESGHRYDAVTDSEERIQGPRIIKLRNRSYKMYFTAMAGSGNDEKSIILSASSEDGFGFKADEGIRLSPDDEHFVGGRIAHAWPIYTTDGKIQLYFAAATDSGGGIITAISEDGLEFEVIDPEPAVESPSQSLSAQDPCLIEMDGGLRMYYGLYEGPTVVDESAIYSAIKD